MRTASSTFAFSLRTASARNDDGGSMHRYASIWNMWFWIMSRSTPALS